MSATFSMTGLNTDALFAQFEALVPVIIDEAAAEMVTIAQEAAERMRAMILAAVTRTGLERVASGRGEHAGRYDSGKMHNAVDYTIEVDEDGILIRWGWLEEVPDYFMAQEWGTEHIAAVGALGDTFTWGLSETAAVLQRITT